METFVYLYHSLPNPRKKKMKEDTLCVKKKQVMKIVFYFEP